MNAFLQRWQSTISLTLQFPLQFLLLAGAFAAPLPSQEKASGNTQEKTGKDSPSASKDKAAKGKKEEDGKAAAKEAANSKEDDKESPKPPATHYIRQNTYLGKVLDVNPEKHCFVLEIPVNNRTKVKATFVVAEDAKIRTLVTPTLFDDRGNLKRPSAKELLELKGKDKHLPGYQSEFDNLKKEQTLKVQQVTTKERLLAERQKTRIPTKPGEKPVQDDYLTNYVEIISEATIK